MEDLSLHILDVAENGIAADADFVRISLDEDSRDDRLTLEIADNGSGMDPELLRSVTSPFTTTRTSRNVGMGLPMLAMSAESADGGLSIDSVPGEGTTVRATFRLGHIDRIPIGDLSQTVRTLIVGNEDVDFVFEYRKNGREFSLDTRELRRASGGKPFWKPEVMRTLRELIDEGMRELDGMAAKVASGKDVEDR